MQTVIPNGIGTVEQAKAFLTELHRNGEAFHPEDDATQLAFDPFTQDEGESLNALMLDIYALPGNDGRHCDPLVFDPCRFLLDLDYEQSDVWVDQVEAAHQAFTQRTENGLLAIDMLIGELQLIRQGTRVF